MDSITEYIDTRLSEKRKIHTYGVMEEAVILAKLYGVNEESAKIAALLHDTAKNIKGDELKQCISELGLDERYSTNPNLAHSKIAAERIQTDLKINDEDIINAVKYHTTGRVNMSDLEKIIYIADMIEPSRDYPGVDELRRISRIDLDKACLLSMKSSLEHVESMGEYLDKDTIDAIEWLESIRFWREMDG